MPSKTHYIQFLNYTTEIVHQLAIKMKMILIHKFKGMSYCAQYQLLVDKNWSVLQLQYLYFSLELEKLTLLFFLFCLKKLQSLTSQKV